MAEPVKDVGTVMECAPGCVDISSDVYVEYESGRRHQVVRGEEDHSGEGGWGGFHSLILIHCWGGRR